MVKTYSEPIPMAKQLMSPMRYSRVSAILWNEARFREQMQDKSVTVKQPDGSLKMHSKLVHDVVAYFAGIGVDPHKAHKIEILRIAVARANPVSAQERETTLPKSNMTQTTETNSPVEWLKARQLALAEEVAAHKAALVPLEDQWRECCTALAAIETKNRQPAPAPAPKTEAPAPNVKAPAPALPVTRAIGRMRPPIKVSDHVGTRQRLMECAEVIAILAVSTICRIDRKITVAQVRRRLDVGVHLAAFVMEFMAAAHPDYRLIEATSLLNFTPTKLADKTRKNSQEYNDILDKTKRVLGIVPLPLLTMRREDARIAATKAAKEGFALSS